MNQGIVVEYHRDLYNVLPEGGNEPVAARLRTWQMLKLRKQAHGQSLAGELTFARQLSVGDRVGLSSDDGTNWYIDEIQPRTTWLARVGTRRFAHKAQLLVANADQLAVVVAARPSPKVAFIDRCLLAAVQGGLDPLLVLNKHDLDPDAAHSELLAPYRRLGLRIIVTSAASGYGIDELAGEVAGQTTVLAGLSGVGKSTLINRLTGAGLVTDHIHEASGQGRHTTVNARMIPLTGAGWLVDTPGVKSFGLTHITRDLVDSCFADLVELSAQCRYADCTHTHEPECAVRREIEASAIPEKRVISYGKLCQEVINMPAQKSAHC